MSMAVSGATAPQHRSTPGGLSGGQMLAIGTGGTALVGGGLTFAGAKMQNSFRTAFKGDFAELVNPAKAAIKTMPGWAALGAIATGITLLATQDN